jgi:hypothetical protein
MVTPETTMENQTLSKFIRSVSYENNLIIFQIRIPPLQTHGSFQNSALAPQTSVPIATSLPIYVTCSIHVKTMEFAMIPITVLGTILVHVQSVSMALIANLIIDFVNHIIVSIVVCISILNTQLVLQNTFLYYRCM